MAEKYRKRIYCEMQFLETCISKLNCTQFSFENFREIQLWKNILDLVFSKHIKLHLNISKDLFFSNVDNAIKNLRLSDKKRGNGTAIRSMDDLYIEIDSKQHGENSLHVKCTPYNSITEFDFKSDNAVANSIFFTCEKNEICDEISEKYGVLVISSHNIKKHDYVLYDSGDALEKKEECDWGKLLTNKTLPCNCVTIIDNYILNDTKQIEENLSKIFDSIFPQKLEIPFQINIITSLKRDKRIDLPSKERLEKIDQISKKLRPNLNFKITICKCPSDRFHDRSIVTNSTLIICGGGFDLFKNGKTQKQTTINIAIPYLNNSIQWINKAFSIIITDIQKTQKELPSFTNDSFPSFFLGSNENRIFEN
jgi:hypothetical protein